MIRNISCLKLEIKDCGFVSDEYQQNFDVNSSESSKVNNNNEISTIKFTLAKLPTDNHEYSHSLPCIKNQRFKNRRPKKECPSNVLQNSSYDFINESGSQSNKSFDNDTCFYYNSVQENKVAKRFSLNAATESVLNQFKFIDSDKPASDTKSTFVRRESSNCSFKCSQNKRMTPMCQTLKQEYAFRHFEIEDVQNYSKFYSNGYCKYKNIRSTTPMLSSNISKEGEGDKNEDEKKGVEDIINYKQFTETTNSTAYLSPNLNSQHLICPDKFNIKNEGNTTPQDHHARRPMNAFLIFCKRHRSIVKDRFKSYENRSITKILGEWWATLDANDKKCYVNLAKQNKDAFFTANPNFKWYKLPAPSLRTLNTRPGNIDRFENQYMSMHNNHCNKIDADDVGLKHVSYFKLADERHMGELKNLMRSNNPPTSKNKTLHITERAISFLNNRNRKCNIAKGNFSCLKESSDKNCSGNEYHSNQNKLVCCCKGRKYQALQNFAQINTISSRQIISSKPPTHLSDSQYLVMHSDAKTLCENNLFSSKTDTQSKTENKQSIMTCYKDTYQSKKQQLDFLSFDLEDKIRRLPALCLETYLQRKNTKSKRKNSKKRSFSNQLNFKDNFLKRTVQSSIQQSKPGFESKEQVIGSQKRKARKESITRRDINSIQSDVQLLFGRSQTPSHFITERRSLTNQSLSAANQNASPDLLILAEVAANRTETG